MSTNNNALINRVFSKNTLKELIEEGHSRTYTAALSQFVDDSNLLSNRECIEKLYYFLKANYQNEYYYKNTLLNKLLLGVHSTRTTTALTEVPVGNSKADFILINGKAVVYEIKTELDNLDRLEGQLRDYYKAFSHVAVVTCEKNYEELLSRIPGAYTGIYVLTDKGTLSERRKPQPFMEKISKGEMFRILRKREYESIIKMRFGDLPKVSQFDYYRCCKALFESLPVEDVQSLFVQKLKERSKIEISEFESIPYELKYIVYFSSYKKDDYVRLYKFLNTEEKGCTIQY